MRCRHGNRHVGMISDFGRRASPSGWLRPPKGSVSFVCVFVYRRVMSSTWIATLVCCCHPLKGLIGLGSMMTEQVTRIHMVAQVWSLTDINRGLQSAASSFYFLILLDRQWWKKYIERDRTEGVKQAGRKFKQCLPKANCLNAISSHREVKWL